MQNVKEAKVINGEDVNPYGVKNGDIVKFIPSERDRKSNHTSVALIGTILDDRYPYEIYVEGDYESHSYYVKNLKIIGHEHEVNSPSRVSGWISRKEADNLTSHELDGIRGYPDMKHPNYNEDAYWDVDYRQRNKIKEQKINQLKKIIKESILKVLSK